MWENKKSMAEKKFDNRPIGVFDSGLGGVSILESVKKILPNESFVYFSDSLNCPYGVKTSQEIKNLSFKIVDYLIKKYDCKMIIVACNTITTLAISDFRKKFPIVFVGVEPAIKPAVKKTLSGKIGLLATSKTLKNPAFLKSKKSVPEEIKLFAKSGTGLVEIVEGGEINSEKTKNLLKKYTNYFRQKNVDNLILGCTHYHFLIDKFAEIDPSLNIIEPSLPVAIQAKNQLVKHNLLSKNDYGGFIYFQTSGNENVVKVLNQISSLNWDLCKTKVIL